MKYVFLFLFLLSVSIQSEAQGRKNPQAARARVASVKTSFISDRLDLTSEQAEKFWPIYRRYEEELWALRRKSVDAAQSSRRDAERTEEESRRLIERSLQLQEERLELKRTYKDQLLRVISAQQLAALYEAEREFHRLLLQRLREERIKRR